MGLLLARTCNMMSSWQEHSAGALTVNCRLVEKARMLTLDLDHVPGQASGTNFAVLLACWSVF